MSDINASKPAQPVTPTPVLSLKELLEDAPLHSPRSVQKLYGQSQFLHLSIPQQIRVHCDRCEGVRRHSLEKGDGSFAIEARTYQFLCYGCEDCTISKKLFAVKAEKKGNVIFGVCTKIYQE